MGTGEQAQMIEGRHYQNAYVTRNVEKAVAEFTARADARSAITFEASTEVKTPRGSGTHRVKLAFIWVGDMQYEFIEPIVDVPSIFAPWLPDDDGPLFHHSCARVDNWDEFRGRLDEQPYPVVMEGGDDQLKFLFVDARDLLGHYLEFTWMNDTRWAQIGGR